MVQVRALADESEALSAAFQLCTRELEATLSGMAAVAEAQATAAALAVQAVEREEEVPEVVL